MKKRFQVVLKLQKLNVPGKVEKAKFIVLSMTGNAYFPGPNPVLSVITTDANNLETASAAAEGGGKTLTADMHSKEDTLVRDLTTLGAYVESIANTPANLSNAVAVITSAGMDVKQTHSHGPTQFHAELTGVAGEVKLRTAFVQGIIYHWQQSTDNANWTEIGVSRKGSFIRDELTSETKYYFRVAIEDNSGMGPWSDSVSILVE